MDNAMSTISAQKLVEMWNHTTNFQLSVSDLLPTVKTSVLMSALIEILHKLGIDREAVFTPPPEEERDEHTEYYWDLIPVINMTRLINHVLAGFQDNFSTKMMDLLNPSPGFAHSILLLLMNLASFYAARREDIEPKELELFQHRDQVAALEQERDDLLTQLNEQAAAKASRTMRLQKMEEDKRTLSEELKQQRQQHEEELRELTSVETENEALRTQLEKRRLLKDALLAELARVRMLRVNDADDIRAQHEHAVHMEKEVTLKLDSLKENLVQKETAVKNLQAVKSKLDEGIVYAQEITTLTETFKEVQSTTSRAQAEVEAAVSAREAALREAESGLSELRAGLADAREQRAAHQAFARAGFARSHRSRKEAEEAARTAAERAARAEEELPVVMATVDEHARDKLAREQELQQIADHFYTELRSFEDLLLQESKKAARTMEEKLGRLGRK